EDAQIRALQQQIQELSKQVDALSREARERKEREAQTVAGTAKPPAATKEAPAESKFDKFIKGFYVALDVSLDDTTKRIGNAQAFQWSYANPLDPNSGIVRGGQKGGPVGRVGYIGAISSNGSNVGYRATHHIDSTNLDFIVQVSTALNIAAAPGLQNTWTKSSNVVTGAIGLGDTFIGFKN